MKALMLRKAGDVRAETVADPRIEQARDAVVRVTETSICGLDLDAYEGRPAPTRSFVPGHEFTGVVEEIGPRVEGLKRGDRVLVPYAAACGDCFFCKSGLDEHCEKGGPLAGGQAQYARVPFADAGVRPLPPEISGLDAVFLGSVIPAGWAAAERCGLSGGETVAVFGCGPVGLLAMRAARLLGAQRIIAVDPLPYRRRLARELAGAEALDPASDPAGAIRSLTDGRGADACIDAVGLKPERGLRETVSNVLHLQTAVARTLRAVVGAARRGGTISLIGAFRSSADAVPLDEVFEKGLRVRAGRPPVRGALDRLIGLVGAGRLTAADLVTHRLPLDSGADAYDLLARRREEPLKVVLDPWAAAAVAEAASTASADEIDALDDARYALTREGGAEGRRTGVDETSLGAE